MIEWIVDKQYIGDIHLGIPSGAYIGAVMTGAKNDLVFLLRQDLPFYTDMLEALKEDQPDKVDIIDYFDKD